MASTMVSARVPEEALERTQAVLKEHGMTMSGLVRIVIEYVSDTGEVPDLEAWRAESRKRERMQALEHLLEHPITDIGDRDVRELLNEARDERYGL